MPPVQHHNQQLEPLEAIDPLDSNLQAVEAHRNLDELAEIPRAPEHQQVHEDLGRKLDPEYDMRTPGKQAFESISFELGEYAEEAVGIHEPGTIIEPSVQAPAHEASTPVMVEEQFLSERLHKHDRTDTGGSMRPVYQIGGKTLAFRSRQEFPRYDDASVAVVDAEHATPLFGDQGAYTEYLSQQSDPESADVLIATNTPEGLISAAQAASGHEDAALTRLKSEMEQGKYTPEAIDLIDGVAGCLYMDDSGEYRTYTDRDAFAIVTASLAGDSEAARIVDARRDAFRHKTAEGRHQRQEADRLDFEHRMVRETAPIPPDKVSMVHSTKHDIEYDDAGNVVLWTASQKRDDRLPRASIHFTPNSQVESHMMGNWDKENKLIVTNLAKMIDANGLPEVMADVDTYFMRNPGEPLVLPDAVVIEPNKDQTELIKVEGNKVTYKSLDDEQYTEADRQELASLTTEYGKDIHMAGIESTAPLLRELTLRQVEHSQGVDWYVQAGPHYVYDNRFQESYGRLAVDLGARGGLHNYQAEARLEEDAADVIKPDNDREMNVLPRASIQAVRQAVASGYMPAARRKSFWEIEPGDPGYDPLQHDTRINF